MSLQFKEIKVGEQFAILSKDNNNLIIYTKQKFCNAKTQNGTVDRFNEDDKVFRYFNIGGGFGD